MAAERREAQKTLLDCKFMKIYSKNGVILESEQADLSLQDILKSDPLDLMQTIFMSNPGENQDNNEFFSIKLSSLDLYGNDLQVITIRNETTTVMFNISNGEKQILRLVNACVSHEMRNPINCILATNLKLKDICREMRELVEALGDE